MRVPATETVIVKPELIRLVRRADSKRWQVHYKLDGVKNWFRRSTDTSDVKEAARIHHTLLHARLFGGITDAKEQKQIGSQHQLDYQDQ